MAHDPESSEAAAERVSSSLRLDVTEGRLGPGDRLKDLDLAVRFGVSRLTIRESLRLLAAEGLVTVRLHSGAMVRRLEVDDVRDIYRVRRSLECSALLSSSFADESAFEAVDDAVSAAERAAEAGRWAEAGTASLRFHEAVVALHGSPSLSRFFAQQIALLRLAFWAFEVESEFQAGWIPRDREIVDLLMAGRREHAERAMRRYLDDSEAVVVDASRALTRTTATRRTPPRKVTA